MSARPSKPSRQPNPADQTASAALSQNPVSRCVDLLLSAMVTGNVTDSRRRYDAKRRETKPWRKFYKTAQWQEIRLDQLAHHPLCERCSPKGRSVRATVVNHVIRHKGDWAKFIAGPFESLCKPCHDRDVQSEEAMGYSDEVGNDGLPVDGRHPFYRNS
jgi:5-methylcytosine-specific restriction protein A